MKKKYVLVLAAIVVFFGIQYGVQKWSDAEFAPRAIEGMCIHPAIQGGMPFNIPEGSTFNSSGDLVMKNNRTGKLVTFTGAACVYEAK